MKLFTQYNRITLWGLVLFFLLSSTIYYFLVRDLLTVELDKSLVKTEKRIREYAASRHTLPVIDSLDDLRVSFSETTEAMAERSFRLIPPTKGKNTDNIREMTFFLGLEHRWYRVTISRKLEGINATALMVMKTAGITLLIIVIAALIVNRVLFRRLWRPFYDSIAAIGRFQLGKNGLNGFPETRIEEFNFMNDQFKQMAAKINQEYLVLKEFTENAAHEMQTPLAVIRSKLDLAIQDEGLSETQSSALQAAYGGVKKLTSLNRALLLMTRISNNQYGESTVIKLKEKLQDKVEQFQELWLGKITVTGELQYAEIEINADLADILLNNLFSNAGKHNIPNGEVMVCLEANRLIIKNTGGPVPLDDSRLFQRFYKGSQHEESNGLGLAILKEICDLSGITPSYAFAGDMHIFTLEWNRLEASLT